MNDVVIRPALDNRGGSSQIGRILVHPGFAIASVLVGLVGIAAVRADFSPSNVLIIALGICGLAFFAVARLALANTTLYVRDRRFGQTNLLGMRKEWPLEEVRVLQMQAVQFGKASKATVPKLTVLSREGRPVTQISAADSFSISDLRRLASAGGMELRGSWEDRVSPAELETQYPGTYSKASQGLLSTVGNHGRYWLTAAALTLLALAGIAFYALVGRH